MQRMVRVVKALRKPFTEAKLKTMFATCRKLVRRLKGWKLSVNDMHKAAGRTFYYTKTIQLASRMLHVFSTKEVIDVILHEIAHAILPYKCDHGVRWKKLHKSFGGSGEAFCRVFYKPQQVFLCKCKTRLSYAPSKLKWCLDCESLERRGRIKPYRVCGQ
jgi:predicted SprT family Zn-dependent metalloprotease